jgi:ATP-dependent exoDNAse (exonuclease V) beta subunit
MDMQSQVTLLLEARARLHACCASASGLGSRRGRAACGCRRAVGFSRPLQRAQEAAKERNRTTLAQINAEIRREKAKLKATVPDLVKLSKKKLKRMPADEKAAEKARRAEKIAALETALDEVPDGTAHERKRREKLISASGPITLNVDVSSLQMQPVSMDHSKESEAFALEFKTSKAKQDEGLDVISKGLRTLKDMGHAMADELYPLQAALYSVMLTRWLASRGWNPGAQPVIGGVAYLFLRGMDPGSGSQGTWTWQPSRKLLQAFDAILPPFKSGVRA